MSKKKQGWTPLEELALNKVRDFSLTVWTKQAIWDDFGAYPNVKSYAKYPILPWVKEWDDFEEIAPSLPLTISSWPQWKRQIN